MPKITLKRVTNTDGTTADLYPTTTLDQIISEGTGAGGTNESLSDYIDGRFILASQKGATNGVAPLSGGKVPETYLPDSVYGGMTFMGTISATSSSGSMDLSELISGTVTTNFSVSQQLDDLTNLNYGSDGSDYDGIGQRYLGHYWIISGSNSISLGYESNESGEWDDPIFDDGSDGTSISGNNKTVETGDWVIITGWDNTNKRWQFRVINNTYQNAHTGGKGVVQLSAATSTSALTNGNTEVITEDGLYGMLVADGSELSSTTNLNKIAPAAHDHDGIYYTESEIGDFFGGTTAITGYNKSNWDTAYGWGDHGAAGYQSATNSQTVTLSGSVTGTGTITDFGNLSITTTTNHNHDTRYYTETEFNNWFDGTALDGHNFTEIKYGANLEANLPASGNIVGTLLIETD